MPKARALAFFLIVVSAAAEGVTVDDLMKLSTIVDLDVSPDGNRVVYAVSTPSLERNAHEATIWIATATGRPTRVAEGVKVFAPRLPVPRLRWSPDGARVSLLGLAGEKPQVFAVDLAGGEARRLTSAPEGVTAYEWMPDGRGIVYLMRDPPSEDEQRRRKAGTFVIHADAPEPATRLWRQAPDGSPAVALTPADQYVDAFSVSPDGSRIAYSAAPTSGFPAQYRTRIRIVAAAGGPARLVVDRPGMNTSPRFSPDGSSIAFITSNGRAELMAPRSLAVASAVDPRAAPRVFSLGDAWSNDPVWAADGRSIFVLTNDGTFASGERMFDQPIVRVRVADGNAERVQAGVNVSPRLSRDGRRLAFRHVEARTMGDVCVLDTATGDSRDWSDVNPGLRALTLGDLREVSWRSSDGATIYGLLLTPPGRREKERVPLLVYCHGGPGGGVTWGIFPQFMHTVGQVDFYPTEAMASAGYAVFFPMPRGGAGYGEAGQRAIVRDWGGIDYRDVMTGVDALVASGVADPDRLGVMGASYGGYLTDWIVTQTGRFKAASSGESICDLEDLYLLSDGGEFVAEYFGSPWDSSASYAAHSPIRFAPNVTTPLLIQHGERDVRSPIAGAWKFYRALRALGKTVELDVYPRATHLYYEPLMERESMTRNLEWFLRWIPPRRPEAATR